MLVVSDTTPIRYLVDLDLERLFPHLFVKIAIPVAVSRELEHNRTPPKVRAWMASHPDWLSIVPIANSSLAVPGLGRNAGEKEAFQLAAELRADWLLMDDLAARKTAKALNIKVIGTLGILLESSKRGLIHLDDALSALRLRGFRVSEKLIEGLRSDTAL